MSKADKPAKPAKGPKAMDNPDAMRLAETVSATVNSPPTTSEFTGDTE